MSAKKSLVCELSIAAVVGCLVLISASLACGQTAPKQPLVDDWTHHRMVYSDPGTFADAARNGKVEQWLKITNDPRFKLQKLKRSTTARAVAAAPDFASRMAVLSAPTTDAISSARRRNNGNLDKDWSVDLNGPSGVGTVNANNATGGSSIKINTTSLSASAPATATASATFSANPTNGQTLVVTNGANSETLTASGAVDASVSGTFSAEPSTGTTLTISGLGSTLIFQASSSTSGSCSYHSGSSTVTFARHGTLSTDASEIAGLIATSGCGSVVGVTATNPTGAEVTITAVTAGTAGNSITVQTSSSSFGISAWDTATHLAGGASLQSGTGFFAFTNSSGTALTTTQTATNLAAAITNATVGVTGSSSSAAVTITASAPGSSGNGITLTDTLSNITWPAALTGGGDGTQSSTTWTYWSGAAALSASAVAANIATTIGANSTLAAQVVAVASGNKVTVTALSESAAYATTVTSFGGFTWSGTTLGGGAQATVQPNMFPAKYGASITNASCDDFVVYPTGMTGTATAANIVAYNNLYSSCSGNGPVPSEYWAYNTGGAVTNSPILSPDGTQVAFIQSNGAGTAASLVVLTWAAGSGTLTAPAVPTAAAPNSGCATTNCSVTLALSGGHEDTYSAPFYDYLSDDALFVGDDAGNLHKFTGVYYGAPAEVTTSPWPVSLGSAKISSPVFDAQSGYVFEGDFAGALHSVNAATGAIHGTATGIGDVIADAPLVDGYVGSVNVFVTTSAVGKPYAGNNVAVDFSTAFTTYGSPGTVYVGTGGAGYYLYSGTFDNVYYLSPTSSGSIYVEANTGSTSGATLSQIVVSGGFFTGTVNTPVTGINSAVHPFPSGVTEFCNNGATGCALNAGGTATTSGTDYIFFSVNHGAKTGCTNAAGNGCILSYIVSNPASVTLAGAQNLVTPATNGCWATSAISVDNSDTTTAGASQIYFLNFNGIDSGGPVPGHQTSSNCTAGSTTAIINAVQAAQSNP